MSFVVSFEQKQDFLHAVVTGVNTRKVTEEYLEAIRQECLKRDCRRVLIEERLEGPFLSILEVFELAAESSRRAAGNLEAVAYVDVNAQDMGRIKFAEDVAVNRALPVAVFKTVAEAERWLTSQHN